MAAAVEKQTSVAEGVVKSVWRVLQAGGRAVFGPLTSLHQFRTVAEYRQRAKAIGERRTQSRDPSKKRGFVLVTSFMDRK